MGKSTVLRMFRDLGAVTLDADDIVDSLLQDKAVLEKILEKFNGSVFSNSGALNRQKIGRLIFSDKEKRDILEEILHPLVFGKIMDFLDTISKECSKDKVVVVEIPLMFEKGYSGRFNKAITVYTKEETALRRLEKSDIERDYALMVLNAQMSVEEKMRLSDFVIDNNGTMDETKARVKDIYSRLIESL